MKIQYAVKTFRASTLDTIYQANAIIEEYLAQGYALTLRQIYYQMVARAIIPNEQREYKRLGTTLVNARLAGLTDWHAIEDRTRELQELAHWESPRQILNSVVEQYRIRKWKTQPYHPEVWIEKDALTGVIEQVCKNLDVPYFSCRGYTSLSEMWKAGLRARRDGPESPQLVIFHLSDHDPSGLDMTRDIRLRLNLFAGFPDVRRIALTMAQIEQYQPPPNPAKLTDSRAPAYIEQYGYDSWELDALEPRVINDLIEEHVLSLRDDDLWEEAIALEKKHLAILERAAFNAETDEEEDETPWKLKSAGA